MILVVGPYSPPVTGQSMAFRAVVHSHDSKELQLIDTTYFDNRTLSNLRSIALILLTFLKGARFDRVYLSSSRSFLGSFKDLVLLLLSRKRKYKVINHLHGADFKTFYDQYPKLLKPILKKAYSAVATSIVLTEGMKNEYSSFPKMQKVVIPNFYDQEFENFRLTPKQDMIITYFSNLICSKGIFDFLEAARSVHDRIRNVRFQIAGEFMSDKLMSANAVKEKFDKFLVENPDVNIDFHQGLKPEMRPGFLSQSSILILPTYYPTEGLPLVILEAMRCGNAIVTTDHNYLAEVINDKNGRLIEAQNPQQLANAILTLISLPDCLLEIQSHNIEEAKSKYPQVKFVRRVNEIIAG